MLLEALPLKQGLVALAFASGLIPSVMYANQQATSSLIDAFSDAGPPSTDSPPLRWACVTATLKH